MTNQDFRHDEYQIMQDVWKVYKKFYIVTDTEEYWQRMVDEFAEVGQKHRDSDLCKDLIFDFMEDIERRRGEYADG